MTTLTAIPYEHEPPQKRRRWTREDCYFLERVGVLSGRHELLDGDIIEKIGQNYPHGVTISRIAFSLMQLWGPDRVITQTTLEVSESDRQTNRPEPDIYVLNRVHENRENPLGSDTLLVVEVSDSTLRDDLTKKSLLYARAGIPELWVMDVQGRKLYVHRKPVVGIYSEIVTFDAKDKVSPSAAPDFLLPVIDLLPMESASVPTAETV